MNPFFGPLFLFTLLTYSCCFLFCTLKHLLFYFLFIFKGTASLLLLLFGFVVGLYCTTSTKSFSQGKFDSLSLLKLLLYFFCLLPIFFFLVRHKFIYLMDGNIISSYIAFQKRTSIYSLTQIHPQVVTANFYCTKKNVN